MASLALHDHSLVVRLEGVDRLLAMRGSVTIPLGHITGVTGRPDLSKMMFMPAGTQFRGEQRAGHFVVGTVVMADGTGKVFLDVRDPARAVSLELARDDYRQVVFEPDDRSPEEAKAFIDAALGHRTPSSPASLAKPADEPRVVDGGSSR